MFPLILNLETKRKSVASLTPWRLRTIMPPVRYAKWASRAGLDTMEGSKSLAPVTNRTRTPRLCSPQPSRCAIWAFPAHKLQQQFLINSMRIYSHHFWNLSSADLPLRTICSCWASTSLVIPSPSKLFIRLTLEGGSGPLNTYHATGRSTRIQSEGEAYQRLSSLLLSVLGGKGTQQTLKDECIFKESSRPDEVNFVNVPNPSGSIRPWGSLIL
jgi:hypothetical protein